MSRFKKTDIQFHTDRGPKHPAVNVKAYWQFDVPDAIVKRFGCSADQAAKAAEFAYRDAVDRFWEDAKSEAKLTFGPEVKVYSEGRSGGWLVVYGLPDVETWDAIMVAKWGKFAREIRRWIDGEDNIARMLEAVEENEWHKEGAEEFNFVDQEDGSSVCIADLKAQAIAAGFGPVIRK